MTFTIECRQSHSMTFNSWRLTTIVCEECDKTEIIVGQLGKELVLIFLLSDIRDEYNKYIIERDSVRKFKESETTIQDLKNDSNIRFRNKMNSKNEDIIFIHGKSNNLIRSGTEITMTDDAFMVKKTKLQKEDAGIYWINLDLIHLGQKALIIAGKPTIEGRSPPNPVLKPEDDYTSILQLECHSVSTSIGDCQLVNNSMYIMWYKNGMRMTELDPTLSQINVTVDHNGGYFTCLATEYLPCYERLQTTKHFDVLNIEECDNVSESKTFYYKPQHAHINVKLEPDQREITVNKNEDLEVRCSAKCHPKCNVTWEKDFQVLESNGLFFITENWFGKDLKIVSINSSHEGVYVCLVNNTHGKAKKGFTLSVTDVSNGAELVPDEKERTVSKEAENKVLILKYLTKVVVGVVVVIAAFFTAIVVAVIVVVIIVIIYKKYQIIIYKKYQKKKNYYLNVIPEERSSGEDELMDESLPGHIRDEDDYELMELHQVELLPGNLRDEGDNESMESHQVELLPGNLRDEGDNESMELHQVELLPGTSRDNSRNGEQNNNPENGTYASLEINTSNVNRLHDPEDGYTRLTKKHRRDSMQWYRILLRKKIAKEVFRDN
ncbi:hypothetical protein LOTGIDRAFT_165142 [Lottia gigantea]|uniref:Ig-like domain-containing protein n=1 Tax=Lottia gigantea TaxID=225164 RepID=V4A3L5_LOTGI|nr:hypothetical protein LOTGIDRAFT_165142 [Lottia gigantea]ESO89550.1 hypothetical protein LOTGIDRAFT_165142 [Lottia gigantea]